VTWNGAPVRARVRDLLANQDFEGGIGTARCTEQALGALRASVASPIASSRSPCCCSERRGWLPPKPRPPPPSPMSPQPRSATPRTPPCIWVANNVTPCAGDLEHGPPVLFHEPQLHQHDASLLVRLFGGRGPGGRRFIQPRVGRFLGYIADPDGNRWRSRGHPGRSGSNARYLPDIRRDVRLENLPSTDRKCQNGASIDA
jgi:hypothetical protein